MKFKSLFRSGFSIAAFIVGVIALAVILYTVFMVYAMPHILKPYVERKAGEAIGGEAHIDALEINPFKISLNVRNFSVANNTVKLNWDSLYIDAQLRSIPKQSICLDELRIHKPRLEFILSAKKDEFSAAQFATEAFLSRANVPIYIKHFIIQNGDLEIFDKRAEKEKYFAITPISFSLEDFSTQYSAGQGNNYNLQFTGLNGGFFRWNGNLQWTPLLSEGEMEIRGLDVLQLRDFYQEYLPFDLQSGQLDLRTRYKIVESPEFGFMLDNTKLVLNKPALLADSSNLSMQAASVQVNSLQLSTLSRTLSAGNVILDSANALYVLREIPKLNSKLFEFIRHNANVPDSANANANMFNVFLHKLINLPRWQIKIDSMQSRQMQVKIIDSIVSPATEHNLNAVQLSFANITNKTFDSVNFNGSALFNSGKLKLHGAINLFPLSVFANLDLAEIPLAYSQNYLNQETWLTLRQGELAARLDMRFRAAIDSSQKDTLLFTGEAEIDNLHLQGKNNHELIKAWQVAIKGLSLMFEPNANLKIANVNLHTPIINLIWFANSPANYSQIQKAKSEKNAQEKPLPFTINQINFNKGTVFLTDREPSTLFSYQISALQGSLKNISSQKRNADVSIQGKMGGYAPFSIKGLVNLFGKRPEVNMNIESSNQDLIAFSPYSGKYAGYRIAKGQIALKANYNVKDNKMQGSNNIVIQHLNFGEAVKSPEATNLPVRLGVALLSDKNGVIDLDVAITGDLDDPEFSVAGLIWKVIKNLLGKAAAAPLKSLMSLIGSNSDPETIVFAPGSAQPSTAQLDGLKDLSQALMLRPLLQLDIYGHADSIHDGRALKDTKLLDKLTKNMPASKERTSASVEKSPLRDTLFAYYQRVEKKPLPLQNVDSSPSNREELLVQAARQVWGELHSRQELTAKDLHNLANARAQNIKMRLLNIEPSLGERVFIVEEGDFSQHIAHLKIRER
jgi:hypothetical protein